MFNHMCSCTSIVVSLALVASVRVCYESKQNQNKNKRKNNKTMNYSTMQTSQNAIFMMNQNLPKYNQPNDQIA